MWVLCYVIYGISQSYPTEAIDQKLNCTVQLYNNYIHIYMYIFLRNIKSTVTADNMLFKPMYICMYN